MKDFEGMLTDAGSAVSAWLAYLAAAGALLALIGGKRTLAALTRWRDAFWSAVVAPWSQGPRSAAALEEFRAKSSARMDEILSELRPNGGGSLRDAIARIETQNAIALGRIDLVVVALGDQVAGYETDAAGLCVWTSPAYCALVARSPNELLGWGWITALHPDDADHVRDNWRSSVEDRRTYEQRFRMIRPDGQAIPVVSRASPIFAGPRLVGWSGLVRIDQP